MWVSAGAGTRSAVTSMASYPLKRNESTLVTGHADGEVRLHSVVENLPSSSARRGARAAATAEDEVEQAEQAEGAGPAGSIAKVRAHANLTQTPPRPLLQLRQHAAWPARGEPAQVFEHSSARAVLSPADWLPRATALLWPASLDGCPVLRWRCMLQLPWGGRANACMQLRCAASTALSHPLQAWLPPLHAWLGSHAPSGPLSMPGCPIAMLGCPPYMPGWAAMRRQHHLPTPGLLTTLALSSHSSCPGCSTCPMLGYVRALSG